MKRLIVLVGTLFIVFAGAKLAFAGPIIIDGADANDHGSAVNGQNLDGWRYMQKALEHLADQVYTGTAKVVVDLGTTNVITTLPTCSGRGHNARQAINSAFNLSTLPSQGWTLKHVDGALTITQWLDNLSWSNTGILYIPTYNNLCGDLNSDELAAINAHVVNLANFINGPGDASKGGALFSQSERNATSGPRSVGAYLWLQTAIPGIVATGFNGDIHTPISLTLEGVTAFPGLTNSDVSTGPWHNWFEGNFGSLKSLAVARNLAGITETVILGGGKGTQFGPPTGNLTAIKTGSLLTDTDQNGVISPGDTLQYMVHIANTSQQVITDVTFTDQLDPNTNLVVGSVQTTQGTVTSGNNPGDISVAVDIGTIAGGQSVDISYDAVITNPMPAGVVTVTNQGIVSSTVGTTPTTDPIHPGPTVITVTIPTTPTIGNLTAIKTGSLLTDTDQNGVVSPGDALRYAVHISNTSQQVITSVTFTDQLDPNTNLVVGSVQTTQGTVTSGNNPGDTSVGVDIGTITVGQSVDIFYDAVITNPMPAGVVTVTNQGIVSSTVGTTPTTDPIHPGPTVITVTVPTTPTGVLNLTVGSDVVQCVLPGSSYHLTWTVANIGNVVFPGGLLTTLVTGSGSAPLTSAIPAIPTATVATITQTVLVSEPVAYGAETVTVTGSILTTTAELVTHICAPDFRTSDAIVHSHQVFAHEELTYTWHISNTGDAAAPGTTAVLTLPVTPLFAFEDSLTSTTGTATFDPVTNAVTWAGDLPISGSVTIVFTALSDFGLPHGLLAAPFEVDHPYRPPFVGAATYVYPFKRFFMLVLNQTSPTHRPMR